MKKILLLLVGLFLCTHLFSQSAQYVGAMKAHFLKLKEAKTPESFQSIANGFERIAAAEKSEWLPKYYAAFCYVMQAMTIADKDKVDAIIDQSEKLLEEASILSVNDEIMCIQALCKSARIGVDPMTRGMKYGMESAKILGQAKALNPNNPRVYYLEGQSKFYTPEAYGGGKKAAKELFEKAVATYAVFKPANELMPTWGDEQTMQMLEECSK